VLKIVLFSIPYVLRLFLFFKWERLQDLEMHRKGQEN